MLQSGSAAPLCGGPEGPRPADAPRRRSATAARSPPSICSGDAAGVFSAGVCVQVSLQIHAQVVKTKRSCVVKGERDPCFSHRMTFKLRSRHLDEACLSFELLQGSVRPGETVSHYINTIF